MQQKPLQPAIQLMQVLWQESSWGHITAAAEQLVRNDTGKHICEDEVKAETDPAVYEEQVGMMEMVMDVPAIHEEMEGIRKEYCKY